MSRCFQAQLAHGHVERDGVLFAQRLQDLAVVAVAIVVVAALPGTHGFICQARVPRPGSGQGQIR